MRRAAGIIGLGAACAAVFGGASTASAATTCELTGTTLKLTLDPVSLSMGASFGSQHGLKVDDTGNIVLTDSKAPAPGAVTCTGGPATTANTTRIESTGKGSFLSVVDPSRFVRPDTTRIVIAAAEGEVFLNGTGANDNWVAGQTATGRGVDLDPGAPNGVDVELGTDAFIEMLGGGGTDHLSGAGNQDPTFKATVFTAPYAGSLSISSGIAIRYVCERNGCEDFADSGADLLIGGTGYTYMRGGSLDDTINDGIDSAPTDNGDSSDELRGGGGNDVITGSGTGDSIRGGDGNDRIAAGAGVDLLTGDGGSDDLDGGAGKDVTFYSKGTSQGGVKVSLDGKRNDGGKGDGRKGGKGGDNLLQIENVSGTSEDDVLIGGAGPNTLSGKGGRDRLDGKGGKDKLLGGPGKDRCKKSGGDKLKKCEKG